MIAYDLQCAAGHSFEGWFEDEKAYREQKKKGLVACPICNDTNVSRVPSAFAIKSSRPAAPSTSQQSELALIGKKIVDYVEKNFEDVGGNFAKEALKIHYGVTEPKNIRGVSSEEEEKTLKKEGVQFFKLPIPMPPDTDS
jgi:hypothetical protein